MRRAVLFAMVMVLGFAGWLMAAPTVAKLSPPDDQAKKSRAPEAFRAGWATAERELGEGVASVYTAGPPPPPQGLGFDETLGLPIKQVAGCVLEDKDTAYIDGHNARLYEQMLQFGDIPGSRRQWLSDLKTPKAWFQRGQQVQLDKGQQTVSKDARITLRLGATGELQAMPWGSRVKVTTPLYFVWGPAGSDMVVFVTGGKIYELLDLRLGQVVVRDGLSVQ